MKIGDKFDFEGVELIAVDEIIEFSCSGCFIDMYHDHISEFCDGCNKRILIESNANQTLPEVVQSSIELAKGIDLKDKSKNYDLDAENNH